jgi:SAM-dependent methyltransferase
MESRYKGITNYKERLQGLVRVLKRIYALTGSQFGIDPRQTFNAFVGLRRYFRDYYRFKACYGGRMKLFPFLHDWNREGGSVKGEYFWQDIYVARKIYEANPQKHVDIGSRIDGFVAHVASFRDIEVFDIRPISARIPGVTFKQADLMNPESVIAGYCDSLSCLHALEHFGLGRYGDPIDPRGYEAGLRNMARILRSGGVFYLSVPLGIERVEFNAHRVFDPNTIVDLAEDNQLIFHEFAFVTTENDLNETSVPYAAFDSIRNKQYTLGIFIFIKGPGSNDSL